MKKIIFISFIIALVGVLSISCEKEDNKDVQVKVDKPYTNESYIIYESNEEFMNKLVEIANMTHEERKNYEIANGYMSFGRYCDEFYENIDFEKFDTQEDIIRFVDNNKMYLELIKEENGEFTVEAKYYDKFTRYMYGINKTFVIKDIAYKVFDECFIACNIADVSELSNITEKNYNNFIDNKKFVTIKSNSIMTKDVAVNNGKEKTAISTTGNNRTKSMAIIELGPPLLNYQATCYAGAKVRPLKRTLGIWFQCYRTIELRTNFDVHYKVGNNWYSQGFGKNEVKYGSVLEFSITIPGFVDDAHFGPVYVYGDTPDTHPAIINY
ncbi:MAG: hypothetical protein M0Q45_08590 [Bacteroidales bacterium]|jgi:hypothetical protein|nr:hypothetical protein [Bacteroidales bacterium]MCK9499549.1 hypothetical protein [Bacteroidales bacterium]MDY0316057.1 hypothetical protein [Bacteroidales bacterium]